MMYHILVNRMVSCQSVSVSLCIFCRQTAYQGTFQSGKLGSFGEEGARLPHEAVPVRRAPAVGHLRHHHHVRQARSHCREREEGACRRPFHPRLRLACHRRDARVFQQRDHAGIGRPGGCPLPRPQGDGRMEATAAGPSSTLSGSNWWMQGEWNDYGIRYVSAIRSLPVRFISGLARLPVKSHRGSLIPQKAVAFEDVPHNSAS